MLKEYRKKIDKIDDDIISLLNERMKIVTEIKKYKKENNISILDSKRETEILEKITHGNKDHRSEIRDIYQEILKKSKEIQNE